MADCHGSSKVSVATKANPWGEGGNQQTRIIYGAYIRNCTVQLQKHAITVTHAHKLGKQDINPSQQTHGLYIDCGADTRGSIYT